MAENQPTEQPGRMPTHRIYVIGAHENALWNEIGAAWAHKDGKGFTIACDALPVTGRIVMRAVTKRPAKQEGQS